MLFIQRFISLFKFYPYFCFSFLFLLFTLFLNTVIPLLLTDYPYLFGIQETMLTTLEQTYIYASMLKKASIFNLFRLDYTGNFTDIALTGFPYVTFVIFHVLRIICFDNLSLMLFFLHFFLIGQFVLGYFLLRRLYKHDLVNSLFSLLFFSIALLSPKFILTFALSLCCLYLLQTFFSRSPSFNVILVILFAIFIPIASIYIGKLYYATSPNFRLISPLIARFFLILMTFLSISFLSDLYKGSATVKKTLYSGIIIGLSLYIYSYISIIILGALFTCAIITFHHFSKNRLYYLYYFLIFCCSIPFLLSIYFTKISPGLSEYLERLVVVNIPNVITTISIDSLFFLILSINMIFHIYLYIKKYDSVLQPVFLIWSISLSFSFIFLYTINFFTSQPLLQNTGLLFRFLPFICFFSFYISLDHVFRSYTSKLSKFVVLGSVISNSIWISCCVFLITSAIAYTNLFINETAPANQAYASEIKSLKQYIPPDSLFISDDWILTQFSQWTTNWKTLCAINFTTAIHSNDIIQNYIILYKLLGRSKDYFLESLSPSRRASYRKKGHNMYFHDHSHIYYFHLTNTQKSTAIKNFQSMSFNQALKTVSPQSTYLYLKKDTINHQLIPYVIKIHETNNYILYTLK